MEETLKKENKMGVMPVNKLLVTMSTPMILSMLVQALYNIVDSLFVAKIQDAEAAAAGVNAGNAALSALGMAFPIQTVLIAFGVGTGVGVNALLSRALGEKDYDTVNKTANNGIFLSFLNFILFFIIGIFGSKLCFTMQKADGFVLEYGVTYLTIVCCGSLGMYSQFIFERILQSTGRTVHTMITQTTGAVVNIILDPILIFGMFGLPEMGVAGAAIATIIGQFVAAAFALILNIKCNQDVHISFKGFKPDWHIIGRIYSVGLPSIIMQSIGSVMQVFFNRLLVGLNKDSVSVFTVYFKLQSLFFMPIFGLNNGMVPILAFNYGARNRKRMLKAIKCTMIYAFTFMFIGFLCFELIPDKLLLLFDTGDDTLISLGVPALRIIGVHYLAAWFCIIGGSVFQALGNGIYSLIVSVARQLVVLVPAAYILASIGGLDLVWWSFPIAEVMSLLLTVSFLVNINSSIIKKIPEGVD